MFTLYVDASEWDLRTILRDGCDDQEPISIQTVKLLTILWKRNVVKPNSRSHSSIFLVT